MHFKEDTHTQKTLESLFHHGVKVFLDYNITLEKEVAKTTCQQPAEQGAVFSC